MGVPKFYRWVSERYPCLSEVVKDYQIPEFDNLYLDMNGVVHVCSHPEDDNPHFRITEEKIFQDIFHYIEVLFRMIKPRKVFFMAIDGVAPRAKMNQQRGRRFRSAREAEDLVRKALEKGEILPKESRFDSNCITPGTPFMVKLHEQIKYFVVKKVTTDRLWQGVRVFLSGHETPGEGEHKIMDFIRYEKAQPGYDPNTRHCLYGLDADLIMLGLVTHEPHFSLLREEVRFGGKNSQKRTNTAEETTFHLLHLCLMREYLDFEFQELKGKLPFGYDVDRIIDDWVLMGFLVGNDFIPHLPHMHIHSECLPLLWRTYKKVLPTLDGYLHDGGELNMPRFEKYLRVLAQNDRDEFNDKYADLKWMESKIGNKAINDDAARAKAEARANKGLREPKLNGKSSLSSDLAGIPTANEFMLLKDLEESEFKEGGATGMALVDVDDEEDGEEESESDEDDADDMFNEEFAHHKASYYMDKMEYAKVTPDVLREQAEGYVRAIAWILQYYYNGVPSWSWYYPHHYAPYLSDVKGFSDLKLVFDMSKPFLPFEQLMSVLPAASKNLLPIPYQGLMIKENSPLKDYYPTDFRTDLNGKMQEWEAVVLIPFIEEKRLLEALEPLKPQLTDDEISRNQHKPALLYQYTPDIVGTYESSLPGSFPDIVNHHAKLTEIPIDLYWLNPKDLKKGLCLGVKQDLYFPGFPTLKHIEHSASLVKAGVKVFQQNSRGENMILEILAQPDKDIEQVAHQIIGRGIYVGWPHLFEARVVAVENEEMRFSIAPNYGNKSNDEVEIVHDHTDVDEKKTWRREVVSIRETYHDRKGVDVGITDIVVHACPISGRKYVCGHHGVITLEKQWANNPVPFALQATVKDIAVKDPTFEQFKTLDQLFPNNTEVFMLGNPSYGCMGEVLGIDAKNDGRIRVDFTVLQEPDFSRVRHQQQNLSTRYMPGYICAQRLGVSGFLFSRITGVMFVMRGCRERSGSGKLNIGLNLKHNKTQMEVPGYTKKINGDWQYSSQVIDIVSQYIEDYKELFDYISSTGKEESYFEEDIWGTDSKTKIQALQKYIKELASSKVTPVKHGSALLDELVVKEIEKEVEDIKEKNKKKKKHVKMQVRPHLLYRPLEAQLTLMPDPSTCYELFDRVINVRDGYSVPLGLRGTVIGVNNGDKEQDISYDVVFDEEFLGGLTLRCSPLRGYRVPASALINISYGERKEYTRKSGGQKPTAVVKPQYTPGGSTYSQMADPNSRRQNNGGQYQNRQQYNAKSGNDSRHQGGRGYSQPRNQGNQQPQQQNNQYQQPQVESDEFTNIWNQLQGIGGAQGGQRRPQSGDNSRSQGGPKQNTGRKGQQQRQQGDSKPSLQQAAKALEQVHFEHRWQPPLDHSKRPPNLPQPGSSSKNRADNTQTNQSQKPHSESGEFSDIAGQKIDVSALFNVPKRVDVNCVDPAAGGQKGSDDFSNFLSALQSGNQKESLVFTNSARGQGQQDSSQEGTKALCQMLKIGPKPDGGKPSVGVESQATQESNKSYGKQVSLNELFEGAAFKPATVGKDPEQGHSQQKPHHKQQQHQRPPPHQHQHSQQYPQPHPQQYPQPHPQQYPPHHPQQQQHHQQQHQQHPQQHPQHRRSNVNELANLCQQFNMFPKYDYQQGRDNKVRAVISLSNGGVFQGSFARNQEQAAESAASVALLNLQPSLQHPLMVQMPGQRHPNVAYGGPRGANFSASPNSAFTPVQGKQPGFSHHNQGVRHKQSHPGSSHQYGPYQGPHQPFPNPPVRTNYPQNQAHLHTKQGQDRWGQHRGHANAEGNRDGRSKWQKPEAMAEKMAALQVDENKSDQFAADGSSKTPSKNPFIPTQVLRQQKTPQRETKPTEETKEDEQPLKEVKKSGSIDENTNKNNAKPRRERKPPSPQKDSKNQDPAKASGSESNPRSNPSTATASSGDQNNTKGIQPRRPKSRIAANFGGMKK